MNEPIESRRDGAFAVTTVGICVSGINIALLYLLVRMITHGVGSSFPGQWPLTMLSVTAGAFGACIQIPTVFAEAVGNRRLFSSHIPWLLLNPVMGAASGAFYSQLIQAFSGAGRAGGTIEAFVLDAPSVALGGLLFGACAPLVLRPVTIVRVVSAPREREHSDRLQ